MANMKCPDCGATMQKGGTCDRCGYNDKTGKSGSGGGGGSKKNAPPSKGKGNVPPQFLKKKKSS